MNIDRTVTTVIDEELCTGCGLCVQVCPSDTITLADGKARVTGDVSLGCGHCAAVCPVSAVRVTALENNALGFKSFTSDEEWLPFGEFDVSSLVRLMRSRRSCRNYSEKPVPRDLLEDLIRFGITAPSGTNSQKWTFTLLPRRADVARFGDEIARFFRRINRLAEKAWLRKGLKFLGKNDLEFYYQNYHTSVQEALEAHDRDGTDPLFHGAAAAIIVGTRPGASCPAEDALLATQNILLGAHALGLGTCLIGFAVSAMKEDRTLKKSIGIPAEEKVHAVIAIGFPKEKYQGLPGRKSFTMRYFSFREKENKA